MSEQLSAAHPTPAFGHRASLFLGGSLLAAIALAVVLTAVDRSKLSTLEHFEEHSAVGDSLLFALPDDPSALATPAVSFHGQALYPVSTQVEEMRDSRMVRAGMDAGNKFNLYRSVETLESEKKSAAFYFLKRGPGEYFKLSAECKAK